MQDCIFREYDIRGKVGEELLIEQVYDLGRAIAVFFVQKNPGIRNVVVGMDGRVHSQAIKDELCRALLDCGLQVLFIGVCPTPVVYFSLHTLPVDAGIIITASHNGPEYNGIKICLGKDSVWGRDIDLIRDLYKSKSQITATHTGTYADYPMIDRYVNWLANNFIPLQGMTMSAVIDCGNGAAGTVLPQLIELMEWKNVQLLYPEVDGTYPHHQADPVVEENMRDVRAILTTTDIQVGIGLDGDCDRMAPMTKSGVLVPGDIVLALFSEPVVTQNPGAAVVFDIKCSQVVPALLTEWGARPHVSPSGHSIIKSEIKKHHALLAGELSCHFFFNDRYFGYDDGIYALLRLFEILVTSGQTLDQLIARFPKTYITPEIRIPCSEEKKHEIIQAAKNIFAARPDVDLVTIDGVRVTTTYGWGIVRASNTQSVICVRCEASTQEGLARIKEDFHAALLPYFDHNFFN